MEPRSPSLAEQGIAALRQERDESLRALLDLTDDECARRVEWWGRSQSVTQRLRAFSTHALDHYQHLHRLLQARGRSLTEPELLLMKAQAMLAEFEVMVLALSDTDYRAQGPNDGDWSADQVLDHVIKTEREYRESILAGIAADGQGGPAESRGGATE